jgi:5-methylcytosine-specific restriction endonuclease McrA
VPRDIPLKRPCLACGRLTTATRCPPCNRGRERARGASQHSKWEWIAYSRAVRAATPWCERCGTDEGKLSVDHIIPLGQGGPLIPPRSGVRVLCWPCHNTRDHWDGPEGREATGGGPLRYSRKKRGIIDSANKAQQGGEDRKFTYDPPVQAPGNPARNNSSFGKTAINKTESEEHE